MSELEDLNLFEDTSDKTSNSPTYEYYCTDSSIFLLPFLGYTSSTYGDYFFNTYVSTDYKLFNVYNKTKVTVSNKSNFVIVTGALEMSQMFTKNVLDDELFLIQQFDLTENLYDDVDAFFDSKFTKLSDNTKYNIRKFYAHDPVTLYPINRVISPSIDDYESIAEEYGVNPSVILESHGQVRNPIKLEEEVFNLNRFKDNGDIYYYVKNNAQ